MGRYLIDTNCVSDYFSNSFPISGVAFFDKVIDEEPAISIITHIELLCWQTDPKILKELSQFISECQVWNISPDVIAHCVALRKVKRIKTPDAIIAATALAYDLKLITNNTRDFTNIGGLRLINPYQI